MSASRAVRSLRWSTGRASARRRLALGVVAAAMVTSAAGASASSASSASSTPDTLSIVAGTGTQGAPTPGTATSSNLHYPYGVAVDSAGNVYIADTNNNEIEKVTPQGQLSIIAGTGTAGTPTAGPATSSALNAPAAVAVDSSGNLYIADTGNNRIEKVTPQGQLSIIAGTGTAGTPTAGPATSSALHTPGGVAVDSSGNVYIADANNNRVEKVTPQGQLSIIAGTGTAGAPTAGPATSSMLDHDYGVAVDSSGNVDIADPYNNMIEKVTPQGQLSIIAGTGAQGGSTPGPATSSELSHPYGVAVDGSGDIYVADTDNDEVDEISPQGALSVIAGTGTAGFPSVGPATGSELRRPSQLAVDPAGDIYIADTGNSEVEEVTNPAPVPPAAPTITSVNATTATGGQAVVSLSAGATNGDPITGYAITATPSAGTTITSTCITSSCIITGLTNGRGYTFTAITDSSSPAGDSSASAPVTATVIKLPQAPTITTPASGTQTTNTTPTIAGTSDPGDTITIMIDSIAIGTTTAGGAGAWTLTPVAALTIRTHQITAYATDAYGDESAVSTPTQLTVEAATPSTPTILTQPPAQTTDSGATITFTDAQTDVGYQCSLDGGPFVGCQSPYEVAGLATGTHSLTVRAIDQDGVTSTSRVATWTVMPKTAPSASPTVAAVIVASRATASTKHGLLVGCRLNAGVLEACEVDVYHDGQLLGSGTRAFTFGGHPQATVRVTFNARGRRQLVASGTAGLKVEIRITTTAFGSGSLSAPGSTELFPPFRALALVVHFADNSARLSAQARAVIRGDVSHVSGLRDVLCQGNTDSVGSNASNDQLGLRRAATVCAYLRALGVDAHLSTVSYGDHDPTAGNNTPAGRADNRRTVVAVTYWDLPGKP